MQKERAKAERAKKRAKWEKMQDWEKEIKIKEAEKQGKQPEELVSSSDSSFGSFDEEAANKNASPKKKPESHKYQSNTPYAPKNMAT